MQMKTSPVILSIVVSLAAFMEVLDTTIANVAISTIAGSLGASSDESTWVLTSYLVSNGIILPLSGWFSDFFGRKRFFLICIIGFTATSFLCGVSTSLEMLVASRLLQGLTGGGLQPVQQAIINDAFPPEKRGMAFAITGITTIVAPIIGPVLGGYITDNYSWRWIFFIKIPIGIIAAILVSMLLEDTEESSKKETGGMDYIGLGLIALGLGCLQIVLDKGQQEDWFGSDFIIAFSVLAVIGISFAIIWLIDQKNPLVNLKLFKIKSFSMSCIMMFFIGVTLYGGATLLPMLVEMNFGYNSTLAGFVLSPSGFVTIIFMPIVGRLTSFIQARYLISFGMFSTAVGMFATSCISPQTDYSTFVTVRILQTVGMAFLMVPCSLLAFSKITAETSNNASAIFSLLRNLGGSVGISLTTSYVSHCQQINQATLVQHLTYSDIGYQSALTLYTKIGDTLGISAPENIAMAKIYKELIRQASILAYHDAYMMMAIGLFVLTIVSLFMPDNIVKKRDRTGRSKSMELSEN